MKIKISAILAGYAAAFFCGLLQVIIPFVYIATEQSASMSSSDRFQIITVVSVILQLFCAAAGGYVAAWVARRHELLHGVVLAVFSIVISLILSLIYKIFFGSPMNPGFTMLGHLLVALIGNIAGAFLRKKANDKASIENDIPFEKKLKDLGNNQNP